MRLLNKIFRPYKYCREHVKRYRDEIFLLKHSEQYIMEELNKRSIDWEEYAKNMRRFRDLKERHANLLASFDTLGGNIKSTVR